MHTCMLPAQTHAACMGCHGRNVTPMTFHGCVQQAIFPSWEWKGPGTLDWTSNGERTNDMQNGDLSQYYANKMLKTDHFVSVLVRGLYLKLVPDLAREDVGSVLSRYCACDGEMHPLFSHFVSEAYTNEGICRRPVRPHTNERTVR